MEAHARFRKGFKAEAVAAELYRSEGLAVQEFRNVPQQGRVGSFQQRLWGCGDLAVADAAGIVVVEVTDDQGGAGAVSTRLQRLLGLPAGVRGVVLQRVGEDSWFEVWNDLPRFLRE